MRLIDDFALTTAIEKRIDEATNEDFAEGLSEALLEVHFAPTVDAVPVVRCKDCKYYYKEDDGYEMCDNTEGHDHVEEDGFCAWGERKDK